LKTRTAKAVLSILNGKLPETIINPQMLNGRNEKKNNVFKKEAKI